MKITLYIIGGILAVIIYSFFSTFLNYLDQKRRAKKYASYKPLTKKEIFINASINALFCAILLAVLLYFFY